MKLNPNQKNRRKSIEVQNMEAQFCQIWPQTKQALELLKSIENNPAASLILATVKAAGDAIVRKAHN